MARDITEAAIIYMKSNPDQKFGAAQVAVRTVGLLVQSDLRDNTSWSSNTLKWQRELLNKIEKAAIKI